MGNTENKGGCLCQGEKKQLKQYQRTRQVLQYTFNQCYAKMSILEDQINKFRNKADELRSNKKNDYAKNTFRSALFKKSELQVLENVSQLLRKQISRIKSMEGVVRPNKNIRTDLNQSTIKQKNNGQNINKTTQITNEKMKGKTKIIKKVVFQSDELSQHMKVKNKLSSNEFVKIIKELESQYNKTNDKQSSVHNFMSKIQIKINEINQIIERISISQDQPDEVYPKQKLPIVLVRKTSTQKLINPNKSQSCSAQIGIEMADLFKKQQEKWQKDHEKRELNKIKRISALNQAANDKNNQNLIIQYFKPLFTKQQTWPVQKRYIMNKNRQQFECIEQITQNRKVKLSSEGYSMHHSNKKVNMEKFIARKNWNHLEFIDFNGCGIDDNGWRRLIESSHLFQNLKWIQIFNNSITTIKEGDLDKFQSLERVSFYFHGFSIQTNPLNSQSVRVLQNFKQTHHNIITVFDQESWNTYKQKYGQDFY